jgi:hypothetical protein
MAMANSPYGCAARANPATGAPIALARSLQFQAGRGLR